MNIGDKVRFTHGKEQGIIRRKIDERTFEVEIEDGFLIPILKNEIVLVASEEANRFNPTTKPTSEEAPISPTDGIFIGFDPFNDRIYSLLILNDTNHNILFAINEKSLVNYKGILSGTLSARSFVKISEYKLNDFETWPELYVQWLTFSQGKAQYQAPLEKKLKFSPASFHKSKRHSKLLNRSVFLFQIDKDAIKIEPAKIMEQIEEHQSSAPIIEITKPTTEVDLHIEKLVKDHLALQPQEMLFIQMNHFEKSLENALASGMENIVFIHGTGNGTLKNEIHKKLAKNKLIKFFKDAQKEKFGYGATLVQLS